MLHAISLAPIVNFSCAVPRPRAKRFLAALENGTSLELALVLGTLLPEDRQHGETLSRLGVIEPALLAAWLSSEYDRLDQERSLMEVVWTGPVLPVGFNVRATASVIRSIVSEASDRLVLAGYTFDLGTLDNVGVFSALKRGVSVSVIANAADMKEATWLSLAANGVAISLIRFADDSLAKFHVKALVADGRVGLVTSANFTKLGQRDNVELGLLVRGSVSEKVEKLLKSYVSQFAQS